MILSEFGGAIASSSNNQKLNTRSSTEAELVASDNFLPKILWTGKFMVAQGCELSLMLYQDNETAMILEKKGQKHFG